MAPCKEINTRPWFNTLYNKNYANVDYDILGVVIDTPHLNTSVIDWIMSMECGRQFDIVLLHEFQQQFSDWSNELFNAVDMRIQKAIKDMFRSRGIYMQIKLTTCETITKQFAALLHRITPPLWPEEELLTAMMEPTF